MRTLTARLTLSVPTVFVPTVFVPTVFVLTAHAGEGAGESNDDVPGLAQQELDLSEI